MLRSVLIAAALAVAASHPAIAQAGSAPAHAAAVQAPDTSAMGSIWSVDFIKTREGQFEQFLKFNAARWKPAREEALRRGHIASYRMLVLPGNPEWDVLLMTEYPNQAAYDAREANFAPILAALRAQGAARYSGPDSEVLRDIRFNHAFRAPPANNPAPRP